jgi:hypothetical protein
MEQNNEITCLQELYDWINNSNICVVTETGDNYFLVEAPNNADVHIWVEKDADINNIICKTIKQLEEFDADEQFMELWDVNFANHNHFKPSQFIKMLQEDEESLKELTGELRKLTN